MLRARRRGRCGGRGVGGRLPCSGVILHAKVNQKRGRREESGGRSMPPAMRGSGRLVVATAAQSGAYHAGVRADGPSLVDFVLHSAVSEGGARESFALGGCSTRWVGRSFGRVSWSVDPRAHFPLFLAGEAAVG